MTRIRGKILNHVCTKACLGWTIAFGRYWFYCKRVKAVVVKT